MQDNTRQKLRLFTENNNWDLTHPSDMERFYEFIIEAYKNNDLEISRDEFLEVINPIYRMTEDELEKWKSRFENGIGLLKVYNKTI